MTASLDQKVAELLERCRKVETDAAIARYANEHAADPDLGEQLTALRMGCSFPLGLGWTLAEKGVSPDKTQNKVERTCTARAPKPPNPAASFAGWAATQPPEFLEQDGLTGALIWASTYFDCKPT